MSRSYDLTPLDAHFDRLDQRLERLKRRLVWGFAITWTLVIATGILTRLVHA